MKNLRDKGEPFLQAKREEENKLKRKRDMFSMMSISGSQDISGLDRSADEKSREIDEEDENVFNRTPVKSNEKSNQGLMDTEKKQVEVDLNLADDEDLKEIKWLLQTQELGVPFNTNILRIALNLKEEKIASVLVANFQVEIFEEMLIRAIKTSQMNFMYCVWAFNKNFEHKTDDDTISEDSSGVDSQSD